jgi:cysteine desulfurase family protein
MIYLDNAATSFPKPLCTAEEVYEFLTHTGANPGRSGHELSVSAARIMYETREAVADFFGAQDPLRVVFTHNATYSINMALKGMLRPGCRVVTTGMEHNAVMRPLRSLEQKGVTVSVVPCAADGSLDLEDIREALEQKTDMVVMSAASNVTGTIMPVREVGKLTRERRIPYLVDTAQAGGVVPLSMEADCIDLLAFTGHKALYGPPGTGGLILGEQIDETAITPLIEGGTGSRSEDEYQPVFLPDRFESGTSNAAGLAGLRAALGWIAEQGIEHILEHEQSLAMKLIKGLSDIPGLSVYGPQNIRDRTGVVSFTLADREVSQIGELLDSDYGIMTRVGLHCAPAAHKTIGTFPSGSIRMSVGAFTTAEEIDSALSAVKMIAERGSQ